MDDNTVHLLSYLQTCFFLFCFIKYSDGVGDGNKTGETGDMKIHTLVDGLNLVGKFSVRF